MDKWNPEDGLVVPRRCATCRHWKQDSDKTDKGLCSGITYDSSWGSPPHRAAFVSDAEGYDAWVTTNEDFFCASWEPK